MDYTTTGMQSTPTIQCSNNRSTSNSANTSPTHNKSSYSTINSHGINGCSVLNKCPSPSSTTQTNNFENNETSSGSGCVDDPETSNNNVKILNHTHRNIKNNLFINCSNNECQSSVFDDDLIQQQKVVDQNNDSSDNFYLNNSSDKLINSEDDDYDDDQVESKLLHNNGYTTPKSNKIIKCDPVSTSVHNLSSTLDDILIGSSCSENATNEKDGKICDETLTQPLLVQINDRSDMNEKKRKSIVKSCSVNSFGGDQILKPTIVEHERPTLHVQFSQSEEPPGYVCHAGDEKHPAQPNTPTGSILSRGSESSSSSSSSSEEDSQYSEAPDGGWGWVVVFASFMINLIADGITFSFGVIFVEFLNYFEESKGKTAWIGSLFMAMPLLSGPIASFLTDRYGCRKVTIAGSILAALGFVLSSFAESMEILFITFGVLSGFGLSLCYVAAVVIVAYYFDKRRSFATGLSVCGSGIGTFIFAPVIQMLLDEYGWRGTTLILAGIFLNMCVCGMLMKDLEWTKQRAKLKRRRKRGTAISADSFSVSNSTNTAGTIGNLNNTIPEIKEPESDTMTPDDPRLFSSLIHLPTYVRNGEKVPLEVLELLSRNRNVHSVLMHNYPSLCHSRSFSEPLSSKNNILSPGGTVIPASSPTDRSKSFGYPGTADINQLPWLRRGPHHHHRSIRTPPTAAYLKDLKMHRHSLTYRGAMLNINRYRLRASSCPDIYRNSMTTIAKEKTAWYQGIDDFKDLLVDILDFSYFSDIRFCLFALSNLLLYTWYDVPYVYLSDYAIEKGYTETDGSMLVAIIGIVNMVGEIFLGWAGDKKSISSNFIYAICMGMCGIIIALVPLCKTYSSLATLAGCFGLFIAANYSLTSIILVELITLEKFTNAYGLLLLVQGIANLIGPPLAGWIYDITNTYDLSFYVAGFFIGLSGLLLLVLPALGKYKKYKALKRQVSQNDVENNFTITKANTNNSVCGKLPTIAEIPTTKSNTIMSDCFEKDLLKDGVGVKV